ncbi:Alpha/Beta hydrolase protein [Amanita rubescens]|nr:Alpha/Beta hydrolase protein [Amanita rubescens]
MIMFKSRLTTVVLLSLLALARSHFLTNDELQARKSESAKRFTIDNLLKAQKTSTSQSDEAPASTASGINNITFTNPAARQFYVDGNKIPLVQWDVGPSWAGLLPISNDPGETRKLFFWFFPPGPNGSLDDLIFWTNGGPGCSSLKGFLQENGPISWSFGQAHATQNQYSWTNLSSILWVEQPVGTGFSQGTPTAKNEEDVASQVVGFLQQFLEVFSELKGKKFYITGESYAGTYIPYIADYIYSNPKSLDLNLQGIWMADPLISSFVVQEQIPAVDFVHKYQHVFSLNNATIRDTLTNTLPSRPKGPLPFPWKDTFADPGCDVWDEILNATLIVNPAFDIYRIFDQYPILWDVLGFPGTFDNQQSPLYFNRKEVKEAIHAPVDVDWVECSNINVFPNGDASLPPVFTVLPNVIGKSKRSVIIHGLGDFVLIADGARIAIQNWRDGKQGFQTPIVQDSFIVDGIGALGNVHSERGLTYIEVVLSGHMIPQFSPWSAYQSMQYLLGFRPKP